MVALFDDIKLYCLSDPAQGAPKLLQKRGGKVITRRPDGVKVLQVGEYFTVRQLDESDEGEYSCSTDSGDHVDLVQGTLGCTLDSFLSIHDLT